MRAVPGMTLTYNPLTKKNSYTPKYTYTLEEAKMLTVAAGASAAGLAALGLRGFFSPACKHGLIHWSVEPKRHCSPGLAGWTADLYPDRRISRELAFCALKDLKRVLISISRNVTSRAADWSRPRPWSYWHELFWMVSLVEAGLMLECQIILLFWKGVQVQWAPKKSCARWVIRCNRAEPSWAWSPSLSWAS